MSTPPMARNAIRLPCHTPAVPSESMSFGTPMVLSPSSVSSFKECPLAFRFSYLERLPEPPAPWTTQGHPGAPRARAPARPPAGRAHRRRRARRSRPRPGRARRAPEFADLELTEDEWAKFHADAEMLVRKYFELEDPRTIRPDRPRAQARGHPGDHPAPRHHRPARARRERGARRHRLQDRLGAVELYEAKSLSGVHMYALLCERMLGRRPAGCSCSTCRSPRRSSPTPSDQSIRGVERAHRP